MKEIGSGKENSSLNSRAPAAINAAADGGDPRRRAAPAGGLKKGPWTSAEDEILVQYVKKHGEGNWNRVQRHTGLNRCGKSCRLRWANHLRPDLKKGSFSLHEENLILSFHNQWGNKWARMASMLPGRTDNEIKNYWNTRMKRFQRAGRPLYPPEICRPRIPTSAPQIGFFSGKPKFAARCSLPLLDVTALVAPPAAGTVSRPQPNLFLRPPCFPFSPIGPPAPTQISMHQPPPQPPVQMPFGGGGMENYDTTLPSQLPSFPAKVELPSSQFMYPDSQFGSACAPGDVGCATTAEEFKFYWSDPLDTTTMEKDTGWSYIGGVGADDCGAGSGGIEASLNSVLDSEIKPEFLDTDFNEGINTKYEPADISNPDSEFCGITDMTIQQNPECDNINDIIGQMLNEQPSTPNIDDIDLVPFHVDQDWDISSCLWNNMPGLF